MVLIANFKSAPNTACTGHWGFCGIFVFFYTRTESSSWSFIYTHPTATNANRWALNCDYAAVVLIKVAIWWSEYKNTLIDVLLDKENSDSYSLKINLY